LIIIGRNEMFLNLVIHIFFIARSGLSFKIGEVIKSSICLISTMAENRSKVLPSKGSQDRKKKNRSEVILGKGSQDRKQNNFFYSLVAVNLLTLLLYHPKEDFNRIVEGTISWQKDGLNPQQPKIFDHLM
jgi:hypothetical protein